MQSHLSLHPNISQTRSAHIFLPHRNHKLTPPVTHNHFRSINNTLSHRKPPSNSKLTESLPTTYSLNTHLRTLMKAQHRSNKTNPKNRSKLTSILSSPLSHSLSHRNFPPLTIHNQLNIHNSTNSPHSSNSYMHIYNNKSHHWRNNYPCLHSRLANPDLTHHTPYSCPL